MSCTKLPCLSRIPFVLCLASALFSSACMSPVVMRRTRLGAYAALGSMPQSEIVANQRFTAQIATESAPLKPDYLEEQLGRELSQPRWPDESYRAELYIAAINVATRYRAIFREPKLDAFRPDRPLRYLGEAEPLTSASPKLRVRLYLAYGRFCISDLQHGRAREYLQRAEALLGKMPSEPLLFSLVQEAQATISQAMGQGADARERRLKLSLPAVGSHLRAHAHHASQWLEYVQLLLSAMEHAADSGSLEELYANFKTAAKVIMSELPEPLQHIGTFRAAELLAQLGQNRRALKLLHGWPALRRLETQHEFHSVAEVTAWRCALGTVYLQSGSPGDALPHLRYCREHRPTSDLLLEQKLALVSEQLGDIEQASAYYEESRQRFEKIRDSFKERPETLAALAAFFDSSFKQSYYGLLRLPLHAGPISDPAVIDKLLSDMEAIRARQLRDRLAREQGQKGDLRPPPSVAGVRKSLASDEVLLNYAATDETLILVAISAEAARAQSLKVSRRQLAWLVKSIATRLAAPTLDRGGLPALEQDLRALSSLVLPSEIYSHFLAEKRRIVLVPDEVLSAVPFDLLSEPGPSYLPLLAKQELLLSPALSLYLAPPPERRRPFRVLGLADPPIPAELAASLNPLSEARAELEDALARREVDQNLCSGRRHCLLFGEHARRSFLLNTDLSPYSILHAATHGLLKGLSAHEISEPALFLAADPGRPAAESFLRASEVEGLRLDAELVILSACDSGSGESVLGEGVLGLGRAFLLHSRTVLMTLWAVDSRAAEELMVRLYGHLDLANPTPRNVAHALFLAKRDYLKGKQAAHVNKGFCGGVKLRSTPLPSTGPGVAEVPVLCTHPSFFAPFVVISR